MPIICVRFYLVEKITIHIENVAFYFISYSSTDSSLWVGLLLHDTEYIQCSFINMYAPMYIWALQENLGHNLNSVFF